LELRITDGAAGASEVDLHVMLSALLGLLVTPKLLGLMLLAIPLGIFFGCVPGLGGKLGIVLLIPFVYGMDPLPGAVFLLSMHAIVHTGGIVPSILFGVPTNGPEAPLLVDGYPMVRNGQAGRALGAALSAAGIGGIIGVICLALILPVVEPFVLSFSPIEFFWLAIIGITLISALAGKMLVQGLIVGCFGWLIGMIGLDPQTGVQRFTFNQLFLWDGFDVISGVLALYALPEMMQLGRGRRGDAGAPGANAEVTHYTFAEVWDGVKDNIRHWGLAITTAVMGTFIGMIPGLGGEAAGWMCYAFAVSRAKDPERFGKGAVEGVIAPSTGMNAKEGGGLLPTLFFGVPAGSGMAIMLGALIMLGIKPGPMMIVHDLPLVWSLIWAIAISNLLCTLFLLIVGKHMSSIAHIRAEVLVPVVLVFALLGTYLAKDHWESLLVFAGMGAIGYVMRRNRWPRPCFIIGLVLGPTAELSFHKAFALHGLTFLVQPTSLVMISIIVITLTLNLRKTYRRKSGSGEAGHATPTAGSA
jgi:putative tricarboxylic transport membrane protein